MKIYEAVERAPLTIPVKEIMNAEGEFDLVPEVKERGYFDIDYRKNELVLIAGKFIGQVPLTKDVTIHVTPKVPLSNLARIIGVANQPLRCLDFFRRKYRLDGDASASLQEAMGRSLIASLRELDSEGVYRQYMPRRETLSAIRGRISIPAFVTRSMPRGQVTSVPCEYFVLTADTVLNRVIKRAIYDLGVALGAMPGTKQDVLRDLEYYFDLLGSVKLDFSSSLVAQGEEWLVKHHLPELRAYYQDVLDVCFIVLAGSGLEVIDRNGERGMHSVLVDLEEAFEEYLRAVLASSNEFLGRNVRFLNGNTDGKQPLFSTTAKYEAKPDIILRRDGICLVIGDAKYKTKLEEKDRYQLIAHAVSYGAPKSFLVTPATPKRMAGPEHVGRIGPTDVFHYAFDLDGDLKVQETAFALWVRSEMCGFNA